MTRPETIAAMLKSLERPRLTLTPWDLGFLAICDEAFLENGDLSNERYAKLQQIFKEKAD